MTVKFIYVETINGGHSVDFFRLILSTIDKLDGANIILVSSQSFYNSVLHFFKMEVFNNICLTFHSLDNFQSTSENKLLSGLGLLSRLNRFANISGVEKIYLSYGDMFVLPLLLTKSKKAYNILLFRVPVSTHDIKIGFFKLKLSIKNIFFELLRFKSCIKSILYFDYRYKIKLNTNNNKYYLVNDIIECPLSLSSPHSKYFPKTVFCNKYLIIGVIDERKGIDIILNTLSSLMLPRDRSIVIRICGMIKEDYMTYIYQLASCINCENISFEINNKNLSNAEFISEIDNCDVVLALYNNHYGSSGIVNYCAARQKPVVVHSTGLMADIVRNYSLGYVLPTNNKDNIEKFFRLDSFQYSPKLKEFHYFMNSNPLTNVISLILRNND